MATTQLSDKEPSESIIKVDQLPGSSDNDVDSKSITRTVLKIDFFVLPILGMFYLLSFLDRTNIGNARVLGLQADLKLTNVQFSTALTVTYVPFVVVEIPMNLLLKSVGPNPMLPILVILWGMITACQGVVKTYRGLLACRFFLGLVEGGVVPAIVLYLSSFYKRHMVQLRFSAMFSVIALAGAFSGLLAAGIQNMDGIRGVPGWGWVFILEGLFTTVFGLLGIFLLPSTPDDIPFASDSDKSIYAAELAKDWSGDEKEHKFTWRELWSVFIDAPHIILLSLSSFCSGLMLFGLANFAPTILNALGFSPIRTQLLSVPPYACAFVTSVISSYFADRYRNKGILCIAVIIVAMGGYAMLLGSANKHVDYAALFLQIIGVYSVVPFLSTWGPINAQPYYRRATGIALIFMSANIGGIVSTWIFFDPPRFRKACIVNVSAAIGIIIFSVILMVYLHWYNKSRASEIAHLLQSKGEGNEAGGWNSPEERLRLGDRHPRFVYTL